MMYVDGVGGETSSVNAALPSPEQQKKVENSKQCEGQHKLLRPERPSWI